MNFLPLIFTVNTIRMWQLWLYGSAPVRYGSSLQQEGEE
ncbi:hypothetical protein SAMN04515695_2826 [Pseudovibrio sp. Tun.PSC04-5.I4]|nr:hypothetical protein SAMN04515695_2826 [Pseudovibrio sp. Tun.PSC04-5.I4]